MASSSTSRHTPCASSRGTSALPFTVVSLQHKSVSRRSLPFWSQPKRGGSLQRVNNQGSGSPYQTAKLGEKLNADYMKMFPKYEKIRRAGVLLHPTSLPGPHGIGDLGDGCYRFIDWLHEAGMQCWQTLPLVLPDPMYYSPYSGLDTNAGNPLLISLPSLVKLGVLDGNDCPAPVPVGDINFPQVAETKLPLLTKAARRLLDDWRFGGLRDEMKRFRKSNVWVEDSALFDVIRRQPDFDNKAWWDWPEPYRFKQEDTMTSFREQHKREIEEFVAIQFLFDKQWKSVREYANKKGIAVIGDMPIYVGGHSADVWANRQLFELSEAGTPAQVSGVPPDAFSETGQLWGSPLFNWPVHSAQGYQWWVQRLGRAMQLFDETRIDHFRGFTGYWSVAATEETAMNGVWRRGPSEELFEALSGKLGKVAILAEDLGVITQDVLELRDRIGAPGMVVLQFAWGSDAKNCHLPHEHYENSFVYPGTHDNETSVGWYKGSANAQDKAYIKAYLGSDGTDIAWDFIRAAMASVSCTAIFMMQDVMRLDNSARMNVPGKAEGNWKWRMGDVDRLQALKGEADGLRQLAMAYGRLPKDVPFKIGA